MLVVDGRFAREAVSWSEVSAAGPRSGQLISAAELEGAGLAARCVWPSGFGVLLPATEPGAWLTDWFGHLALRVVDFSAAFDGRGFSCGGALRELGYRAELRARGPLIPDQAMQLRAVGFDAVEIPDELAQRHTEAAWTHAWSAFPARYQRARGGLNSILQARHATL